MNETFDKTFLNSSVFSFRFSKSEHYFNEKPDKFVNAPSFPPFRFSEFGNHICTANMIWKGACTNLLREKFSRTFGEKVACEARRMRCRTHSVRYFNNCFCMDNACLRKLHLITPSGSFSSKEKPDGFSKTPKFFPRSGRLTSLQLQAFPFRGEGGPR